MNHTSIVVAAFLATAVILTSVAVSALPQQQAFAHNSHHRHHNNHNSNDIRVSQEINQLNNCTRGAYCDNQANNQLNINH
jgi:hypothetical protein